MENKEKNKITVRCQECNNEFEAQRTSAKFCSAKCRVKFNSRLETPKEVQIKPEIEKTVESTRNETQPPILPVIDDIRVVLDTPILQQNEAVVLASFDELLKIFHNLIESNPKPSDIKLKLEQIKESAKLSNLTPRQTDAIVDRVNHLLNGQYNTAKHNLKLS